MDSGIERSQSPQLLPPAKESLTPDIISEKRSIKESQPPPQKEMVVEKGEPERKKHHFRRRRIARVEFWPLLLLRAAAPLCCVASFCPCVIQAQNERRLDYLARHGTPDPQRRTFCAGETLTYDVIDLITNIGWALQVATRAGVRQRYQIHGTHTSDCYTPYCCRACDLVQVSRELELEENSLLF
ncbi:uncharacterized protein LACBIDRAFT_310872 [Laccaria bicolor S238N-H82]|uniref:Predicted protein n=1 Tax=Laccaria bicolor (strain S238N-H82 / ATCC MYA-4686) TaxID=486041 RepID=B0DVA3_LACBS|nr:uncharacterized protein LACBIDRAFT_310872 [Laccaria bicolor S238N-H82]EDR01543.1 predicted protein [Laccaria bicolor S238N-H82]|eukprot:XP_001887895.1 predicted protein [Laccaria bicolor S238N-H82]